MPASLKILLCYLALLCCHQSMAGNTKGMLNANLVFQNDSVRTRILQQTLQSDFNALKQKASDSVEKFREISLIYAELKDAEQSYVYAEKYISNSADISILNKDSFNYISDTREYKSLLRRYLPKFDILSIIYLYIAFIGLFFALVINFKRGSDNVSNLLIGGFVLIHSLFILDFALYTSNIRYQYPHVLLMSSSVALLYGPLLYLYFRRITRQTKISAKDVIHVVPFVLLLIALIPVYRIDATEKLKLMFDLSSQYSKDTLFFVVFIPKLLSYLVYSVLIGRLYFMDRKKVNNEKDGTLSNWKRNIYYIHVLYMFSYAIYGLSVKGIILEQSDLIYHSQILAMSFMVLYVAQTAYVRPKVFDFRALLPIESYLNHHKYYKSGLTDSLSEELKAKLLRLLNDEKIYMDNSLNLESLSQELGTNRHNTSQIINEHFEMNFFELINKFRIEEAKELLVNDTYGNLNIIDIAYEVGYNNKVTFNKAFKKETSQTPTQYIEAIKNRKTTA